MLWFHTSLPETAASDPCPPPSQSHVPKCDGGHGVFGNVLDSVLAS